MCRRFGFVVVILWFALCLSNLASAAIREWNGSVFGLGQFTDPLSWFNGVPTNNTTSDSAKFYGFLGGPILTTVNLSVERSVRGLAFPAPVDIGSAINFTFTGSRLTIGEDGIDIDSGAGSIQTINNPVRLVAGESQDWSIVSNNLHLDGPLSGSGDMYKNGSGTLTLTDLNTNTGRTGVLQGLLLVTGSGRLSDKSTVEVATDGILRLDGMTDAINGLLGSGLVQLVNGATLVVGNSINDSEGIGYFRGLIEGTGGELIKRGPGTFGLGTGNSYTGGTRVESGMLVIDNSLGSATGSGDVEVFSGARLTGGGSISGQVTAYAGAVIAPGINDVTLFARDSLLSVGEIDLQLGATLEIELGGKYVGENTDTLATNAATVAGSLSVSLVPGFTPDYGEVFEILTAGSPIVGTFAGLPQGALVGNFAGTGIYIDYSGNGGREVNLRAINPGDFDVDGDIDGRDFLAWQRGESPNPFSAGDLADWQNYYGAPPLVASTAVPETGTLVLLLGGLPLAGRRGYAAR